MYQYDLCEELSNGFYNLQQPLSKLPLYKDRWNLQSHGICKDYWIQTVFIQSCSKKLTFQEIQDLSVKYEKGWIHHEYESVPLPSFSFYQSDLEEIYERFTAKQDSQTIEIKQYKDYFTFAILSPKKLSSTKLNYFIVNNI